MARLRLMCSIQSLVGARMKWASHTSEQDSRIHGFLLVCRTDASPTKQEVQWRAAVTNTSCQNVSFRRLKPSQVWLWLGCRIQFQAKATAGDCTPSTQRRNYWVDSPAAVTACNKKKKQPVDTSQHQAAHRSEEVAATVRGRQRGRQYLVFFLRVTM